MSFRDKRTAAVWADKLPKGFPSDIAKAVRRKLRMVDGAVRLDDLKVPPGNRLEALKDDRAGQHSIRINDQWRVCFHLAGRRRARRGGDGLPLRDGHSAQRSWDRARIGHGAPGNR